MQEAGDLVTKWTPKFNGSREHEAIPPSGAVSPGGV
jgi:hypothetical protein